MRDAMGFVARSNSWGIVFDDRPAYQRPLSSWTLIMGSLLAVALVSGGAALVTGNRGAWIAAGVALGSIIGAIVMELAE